MQSLKTAARVLEQRIPVWFNWLGIISGAALVVMMMLTVADAVGRRLFSAPIYGSYEGVRFLLSLVFFFGLCYCTAKKGHFVIDAVTSRFPPRGRYYVATVMYLISMLVCWLLAWQTVVLAMKLRATHITGTELIFLALWPFALVGAFCFVLVGIGFLAQFLEFLVRATEPGSPAAADNGGGGTPADN